MENLNSTDWATANIALRRRRDEMDALKRQQASTASAALIIQNLGKVIPFVRANPPVISR